jgi:hypothetical protein
LFRNRWLYSLFANTWKKIPVCATLQGLTASYVVCNIISDCSAGVEFKGITAKKSDQLCGRRRFKFKIPTILNLSLCKFLQKLNFNKAQDFEDLAVVTP